MERGQKVRPLLEQVHLFMLHGKTPSFLQGSVLLCVWALRYRIFDEDVEYGRGSPPVNSHRKAMLILFPQNVYK